MGYSPSPMTNVKSFCFQSLPQRDFIILAARTPDRGDSSAAAGSSVDKEWVTEHARQVDISFLIHTLSLSLLHALAPKVFKQSYQSVYFCSERRDNNISAFIYKDLHLNLMHNLGDSVCRGKPLFFWRAKVLKQN